MYAIRPRRMSIRRGNDFTMMIIITLYARARIRHLYIRKILIILYRLMENNNNIFIV